MLLMWRTRRKEMMDTLAGTFSHLGEMSSKTDGSTFVGLLVKSQTSMLTFIKLPFHVLLCDFFLLL